MVGWRSVAKAAGASAMAVTTKAARQGLQTGQGVGKQLAAEGAKTGKRLGQRGLAAANERSVKAASKAKAGWSTLQELAFARTRRLKYRIMGGVVTLAVVCAAGASVPGALLRLPGQVISSIGSSVRGESRNTNPKDNSSSGRVSSSLGAAATAAAGTVKHALHLDQDSDGAGGGWWLWLNERRRAVSTVPPEDALSLVGVGVGVAGVIVCVMKLRQ